MMRRPAAPVTVELPPLALRAEVVPQSVNPDARTVDVVFSTGASVDRIDVFGTPYQETLSLAPGALRLDRLNSGRAPFLNAHSAESLADQLGVVEPGSARVKDGRALATIRFSKREAVDPIWRDMLDGIYTGISVGYRVHKYERTPADDGMPEVRRAVDWEPYEISAVPMSADIGAYFRTTERRPGDTAPCVITTVGGGTMEESRAALEIKPDAEPQALPVEPSEAELATQRERKRVNGIIRAAMACRIRRDDPLVLRLINDGTSLEEAQGTILDTLRGDPGVGPGPGPSGAVAVVTRDALDFVWDGMRGAILHRIKPHLFPLDDKSRQYRAYSTVRIAEECLEQRGIRTRNLSSLEIVGQALGLETRVGYHTTSDFANLLADVANKSLRAAYAEAPQTWLPLATRISIRDFRPIRRLELGEGPALKQVLEHGEFTRGTIGESKEQLQLVTYGRVFAVTRQALVNDDLDAFGRVPMLFARSARSLESDLVWAQILSNPVMSDGVALFHANHNNLVTPGSLISINSLGQMRSMIALQKNPDNRALSLRMRYLIVPPSAETLAQQFTASISANTAGAVNPLSGLEVISEPRLQIGVTLPDGTVVAGSAIAWYGASAPDDAVPIIEYGYLDGQDGPALDTRVGFDVDGVETKCRLDFAAKIMNYRGVARNDGAAIPVTLTGVMVGPGGTLIAVQEPEETPEHRREREQREQREKAQAHEPEKKGR